MAFHQTAGKVITARTTVIWPRLQWIAATMLNYILKHKAYLILNRAFQ